jgi:hypothetical protein
VGSIAVRSLTHTEHPDTRIKTRLHSDRDDHEYLVTVVIENRLRNGLIIVVELGFAPLDDTGAQLLFRFAAAAYERRSLGIGSYWTFESWGRFLPEHTLTCPTTCLRS